MHTRTRAQRTDRLSDLFCVFCLLFVLFVLALLLHSLDDSLDDSLYDSLPASLGVPPVWGRRRREKEWWDAVEYEALRRSQNTHGG